MAMASSNQVILQFLSMAEEIRIIRTDASQSESLAVCYTGLAMTRVTAGRVKILMRICGLKIQISSHAVIVLADTDIEKIYLMKGVI